MTNSNERGGKERFYLEDLHPGQRFTSGSHTIDEAQTRSRPDRGMVTVRAETRNQRGEDVQTLTVKLVAPRRPDLY
ncbi:MAG TPA: hypothetical protein VJ810_41125 [Blastocatellia bacterium]|nr:hypothetical protein [Blastocatellia bacterium]